MECFGLLSASDGLHIYIYIYIDSSCVRNGFYDMGLGKNGTCMAWLPLKNMQCKHILPALQISSRH